MVSIIIALSFGTLAVAETITVTTKNVRVVDGDSLSVKYKGRTIKTRSSCIDTPEKARYGTYEDKQHGKIASQFVSDLIGQFKYLQLDLSGQDRYKRFITTVYGIKGNQKYNINLITVQEGYAYVYKKYCKDKDYYRAFEQAKVNKKGLFALNMREPSKVRRGK
ncbi:thermonuclease family protein [Paraphotobacterium marinum]|uniref:thermonuclease family protein n=1 Tax=Paraphotobacterium marinum TaxID=1755811 RepID=UPI0039EBD3D2